MDKASTKKLVMKKNALPNTVKATTWLCIILAMALGPIWTPSILVFLVLAFFSYRQGDDSSPKLDSIHQIRPIFYPELKLFTGQIIDIINRDESRVSGSGGGGFIGTSAGGNVSGYIQPISIAARTIRRDEVWIKDQAGRELSFYFDWQVFNCRKGQAISIAMLGADVVAAKNLATGQMVRFIELASYREYFFPEKKITAGEKRTAYIFALAGGIGLLWLFHYTRYCRRINAEIGQAWIPHETKFKALYSEMETALNSTHIKGG